MRHVYLSPHLDDAVLSCGGAMHRQRRAGEEVLALTIFAGEPAEDQALSPFALKQHAYWGAPARPTRLRRAEDAAALALLDVEAVCLDFLDAVYRATPVGLWPYDAQETLFGAPQPGDPIAADDLARALAERLPPEDDLVLYAPLAAGRHVDHQVVHLAAHCLRAMGYRLTFYEDYPYAEAPEAVEKALEESPLEGWQRRVIALEAVDVAAKVAALGYYRSQMWILFGGAEAMPSRVWAFAAGRCPGAASLAECTWQAAGDDPRTEGEA
jgi:LmbE family N-acetylglucosaminyl deacetylase